MTNTTLKPKTCSTNNLEGTRRLIGRKISPIAYWRIITDIAGKNERSLFIDFCDKKTDIHYKISFTEMNIINPEKVEITVSKIQKQRPDLRWEKWSVPCAKLPITMSRLGNPTMKNNVTVEFSGKLGENNFFPDLPAKLTIVFS